MVDDKIDFKFTPVNKGKPRRSSNEETGSTIAPVKASLKETEVDMKIIENEECVDFSDNTERLNQLYDRLWGAADELRANSALRSTQYSTPVLGILFLRYADHKFEEAKKDLEDKLSNRGRSPRKLDYQAAGVLYLIEEARYGNLLDLPEGSDIGGSIDNAMRSIELENEELRDVLPKLYGGMGDAVLINLLKLFHKIPTELDHDIFGKIYEYFLGKFAMSEGQGAGEFYTPTSIVRLIVEIIEPYHGRILDPACGSGGMFVQSAEFIREHLSDPHKAISIYGQEKADDIVRLCKMNLAIHGLSGDIKQGNTYYEDLFKMKGEFDFVMANPPFNVNNVDKEAIKDDPRFALGIPRADNANYLWIQVFYSMLNETGRTGFVMANSASDARHSELEVRRKLIDEGVVDVIISIASNFFYTVTLPVTLWFFDNGKKLAENRDKVLFIDARNIYHQIDRAHREFTSQQIEFISNIVRLYRGKEIETLKCSTSMMKEHFPELKYQDIKGLCKVASIENIKKQGWSLNPGRYVGIKIESLDKEVFQEKIIDLSATFSTLVNKSHKLEITISKNLSSIIERLQRDP